MTSLLAPFATLLFMGSSPLAIQANHAFFAPADQPAAPVAKVEKTLKAQDTLATPVQEAPVLQPVQLEVPPVAETRVEEKAPSESTVDAEVEAGMEAVAEVTPPDEAGDASLTADERTAILSEAAAALAAAKTAKGRFVQVSPDGSVTEGEFALRRPGRMRFDYDEPTPVLIVADGSTVAMEDSELETVDRVPLGSTPLGMILDDKLDFQTEADVTSVERTGNKVAITAEDPEGEAEGELTLYFDATTYELLSWRAIDANRQTTLVALQDVETNVSLDPRLFILEDPADEEEDER